MFSLSKEHLAHKDFDYEAELGSLLEQLTKLLNLKWRKARILTHLKAFVCLFHRKGDEGAAPATTDSSAAQWDSRSPIRVDLRGAAETCQRLRRITISTKGVGGQIFHHSIDKKTKGHSGPRIIAFRMIRSAIKRLIVMSELAFKKAGSVKGEHSKGRHCKSFKDEYDAGAAWLDVNEWFHGNAVVIVFVLAGAATSKVHYRWTKYLRDCLAYLVQYLYGIRKLVQALGPDALETYPLTGYLEEAAIRRVEATEILDES